MSESIFDYCRRCVDGWESLPVLPNQMGENPRGCSFIRTSDGLNFIASIKDFDGSCFPMIHVSIAPIRHYRPEITDESHTEYIVRVAGGVIQTFFGDRVFARAPDHPKSPQIKHFFSLLNYDPSLLRS